VQFSVSQPEGLGAAEVAWVLASGEHLGSCLCQPYRQKIFLASHTQDCFREVVAMQSCLFLVCDTVCLLSLYTWKGEPAVLLEKGSNLTNGRPYFEFWKHRVWSRRNPHSLAGSNPQRGFAAPVRMTSLATWS